MACRPARRITNTNGVVFQTSAIISAENAAFGSPSHDTGEARMPARINKLFKIPYWSLKIHAHKTAITAVGNVQGIKRMVRTAPLPRIQVSADKASTSPATNSIETVATVKRAVVHKVSRNRESKASRTKLAPPANSA